MEPRAFRIETREALMRVASMLSKMLVSAEKPLLVEVADWKAPKTRAQEKLFHSILGDVAANLEVRGRKFSLESWKEYFARKYLGVVEIVMPDGEIVTRRKSTAEANVAEYNNLIDRTLQELAEDYDYLGEAAA